MNQFAKAQASSVGIATLVEAIRLEKEGRYDEAWARCQAVLKINPRHPDALHISGVVAMRQGRLDEAGEILRKAVKIQPKFTDAYINLAHVYSLQGKWRERMDALKAVLALHPGRADVMADIGKCHDNLGRWADAAEWFAKALAAGVDPLVTRPELATAKMRQGQLAEAEAEFQTVLRADPANTLALANLAVLRDLQGDMDAVLPLLDRLIAARPDHVEAHYNRALAFLTRGCLPEGWAEYAWRFRRVPPETIHAHFPQPYWQGEPLAGRCVLVWTEQGPGDEILLGTMLPELAAQAAHCIVVCTPRLVPLFRRAFPNVTVATLAESSAALKTAPAPDVQASLSHLGQWLRPSFERFPATSGYLNPDPAHAEALRARYAERASGKRLVGISWRSANIRASAEKSTSLRDWQAVLRTPGVQFVSLQYGDARNEIKRVSSDFGIDIIHDAAIDPLKDMDAFTAQVAAMDEVISVSNTTVHVAGGLGKPVSVLVPASYGRIWYWFLDRADSPWYRSACLYRQARGQAWTDVVATAAADFSARVARKS